MERIKTKTNSDSKRSSIALFSKRGESLLRGVGPGHSELSVRIWAVWSMAAPLQLQGPFLILIDTIVS